MPDTGKSDDLQFLMQSAVIQSCGFSITRVDSIQGSSGEMRSESEGNLLNPGSTKFVIISRLLVLEIVSLERERVLR